MADTILYVHPKASVIHDVDFQDVLPSTDSAVEAVGSGSTITAVDSSGKDKTSAILSGSTISSKIMTTTIHNVLDGEEYLIIFLGEGATSGTRHVKTVKVLGRRDLTGEF